MKHTFKVGAAFGWGFKTYFSHFLFFIQVLLAVVLSVCIILLVSSFFPLLILFLLVSGLFYNLGFMKIELELYTKGSSSISVLFSQGHVLLKVIVAQFIYWALVLIGLFLLVIPGLYIISRYYFYLYVIVDQNAGIVESFQESSRLTEGVRLRILGLAFVAYLVRSFVILAPAAGLAEVFAYKKQVESLS